MRELARRWPGFPGFGRCNETPPISRGHLRGDKKWEEDEQTGIQESPAMTAVRVYFLETRHGGEVATDGGRPPNAVEPPNSPPSPRACPADIFWVMEDTGGRLERGGRGNTCPSGRSSGAPTSGGGGGEEQVVDPRGPILGLQKRRASRVIFGPQLTELVCQLGFFAHSRPSW